MEQGIFMVIQLDSEENYWKLYSDYDPEIISKIKSLRDRIWIPATNNSRGYWKVSKQYTHEDLEKLLNKDIFLCENARNTEISKIPKFTHNILFDFQVDAINRLLIKKKHILADEMGLGKSAMSICGAHHLLTNNIIEKIIIICPKSLKMQWKNEIMKWTKTTEDDICIIEGSKTKRSNLYLSNSKWMIVNYEQLRCDLPKISIHSVMIFDEASKLKNNSTKIYEIVYSAYYGMDYVWLLTGTPIENSLENFFNLINIVNHNFMKKFEFYRDYVVFDNLKLKDRTIRVPTGYTNIQDFKMKALPYYTRREKKDVASHLLPKNIEIRNIELTKEQEKIANSIYDYIEQLENESEENKGKYQLVALSLLRSIASHPQSLLESESDLAKQCYNQEARTNKIDEVRDIIDDNNGKIIIFTEFARSARILAEELKEYKPVVITGGMDSTAEIDRFKKDDSLRLLIMTNVGAYGLSIDEADTAIIYDLPWNPAVLKQKEDRIYRINSTRQKSIIYLISGIEHRIYDIIIKKQELFDNTVVPTRLISQLIKRG